MNDNSRRKTTRQRRESRRRSHFLTHIIIAVVALVECLLLLTFTSYSWIETSSSLIISTGSNYGMEYSMAVAQNLSYQVLVSPEAGGSVKLAAKNTNSGKEDDGYYRKVQGFSFSKTSSPDGKTFYFEKNDGTSNYRTNDTTDINTTYTYLDFEVKNTTGYAKEFCFRDTANTSILTYKGNLKGADAALDTAYQSTILNAMRISFEVSGDSDEYNSSDPLIVSLAPQTSSNYTGGNYSYYPINSTTGTTTTVTYNNSNTTPVRYHSIDYHKYITPTAQNPDPEQHPLFTSYAANASGTAVDRVSIRIWFDEKDYAYSQLTGDDKLNCDKALHAADISVNFSLVSDTIDYDAIYFDDYAFSNKVGCEGKFVTDENEDYSVYLHAFSNKESGDGFKNFKMTKVETNDTPANRWVVSVPLGNVVQGDGSGQNYLTKSGNVNPTKWDDTYFYYGNASGTERLYQWNFSNLPVNQYLEVVPDTDPESGYETKLTDRCSYFRNLGVVRDSSNHNTNDNDNPIIGFMEYDRYDGNNPMQLTYLRDEATALTGEDYNASVEDGALNYKYITAHASESYDILSPEESEGSGSGESGGSGSSGSTITLDYNTVITDINNINDGEASKIFYYDVPKGWYVQFAYQQENNNPNFKTRYRTVNDGGDGNGEAIHHMGDAKYYPPIATDGTCYYVANGHTQDYDPQYQIETTAAIGDPNHNNGNPGFYLTDVLPALNSNDDKWVRVYFYKNVALNSAWGNTNQVYIKTWSVNNAGWGDVYPDASAIPGNFTLMNKITDNNGESVYHVKGGGSGGGGSGGGGSSSETLYQSYKGGVYLNLRDGNTYETLARKTIGAYYDTSDKLFKAYVPQSWAYNNNSSGFDIHYNELDGYYDCYSDKIRWATGKMDTDTYTYSLLGYTDSHTVAELNENNNAVGTGVGTWDSVRRIEYTTELLYNGYGEDYVYKTGTTSSVYPMAPDPADDLYMKFFAYVPVTGLDSQSTNHNLRFTRHTAYTDNIGNGIWYPQENLTSKELTYYAIDSTAASSGAASDDRGWFHVAVFVDGTFENIVYDTLYGTEAVNNASLKIAEDNGTSATLTYRSVVTTSVTTSGQQTHVNASEGANVTGVGNSRWIVPLAGTTKYAHFRWTPYPATETQFDYTVDLSNGIYCVVTEAN